MNCDQVEDLPQLRRLSGSMCSKIGRTWASNFHFVHYGDEDDKNEVHDDDNFDDGTCSSESHWSPGNPQMSQRPQRPQI